MGSNRVKIEQIGFDSNSRKLDIDVQIKKEIEKTYSIEDEVKILRKALLSMGCNDKDFKDMNNYITAIVEIGKGKKAQLREAASVVISKHDEKKFKPKHPMAPINQAEKAKKDELEAHKKNKD